jgi:hypothetical protein
LRSQFEELAGMLVCTVATGQAGKHARKFGHPLIAVDARNLCPKGPVLVHRVMIVRVRGDLREVSDYENLPP